MKLKLLLLSLLLPLSSFGATNLFDNILVNSNVTTKGSMYFKSPNGTKTLTSFDSFGNLGLQLGSLEQATNYAQSPVFIMYGAGAVQSFLVSSNAPVNSIGTIYVSSAFTPLWFRGNDLTQSGTNSYDIVDSTSVTRFSINPDTGRTFLSGMDSPSNTTSRARAVAVGVNSITNTIIQGVHATYGGAVTNITWPVAFTGVPFVSMGVTTSGGTALLNDRPWVTNVTASGCTVGFRTAAGLDSVATITVDVTAHGLQ